MGGVFNLRVGGAYVGILYWKIDNIQSIRNNLINNIFFLFENIARRDNTVQVSSESFQWTEEKEKQNISKQ